MTTKHCEATTSTTGARCTVPPLSGSRFCFFHDPDRKQERLAASQRGGARGCIAVLPPDAPDVSIQDPIDALKLLDATASQVRRGEIDVKIANCIGNLIGIARQVKEAADLERRINELESLIVNK